MTHPDTELQLASQLQTTNDLLREILVSIQDLKSSGCTSSVNSIRDGVKSPIFHFPCLSPEGTLLPDIQGKALWAREQPEVQKAERAKLRFEALSVHRLRCTEMQKELEHLIEHYKRIGGDEAVMEWSELLKAELLQPVMSLEKNLTVDLPNVQAMAGTMARVSFGRLLSIVRRFHESLYHQKHAFYFGDVKKWEDCLEASTYPCATTIKFHCFESTDDAPQLLDYICHDLFSELETAMARVSGELTTFREKALPTFLADEKERATTRYVHITTIATFFSSVTATTLQFSYAQSSSVLGGIVNLFWFLSLVFSVSSGVSSLLGMTWRKSSIYNSLEPPKLIRMWLDKAPMVLLIVAAVAFVIGLNLFAYLSLQPSYVSLATNTLTGLHSGCLLIVTAWFIYRLKHTSIWAQWIRDLMRWFDYLPWKLMFPYRWLIGRPYAMHIRRNVYWAFEKNKRVSSLNYLIEKVTYEKARFQLVPCLLAKHVRHLRVSVRRRWLKSKKTLLSFRRFVSKLVYGSSHEERGRMDFEAGELKSQIEIQPTQLGETTAHSGEDVKSQFYRCLQTISDDDNHLRIVMDAIRLWETGRADRCTDEWLEDRLRNLLWGFPALVENFYGEVYPILSPIRAQNVKELEEERNGETPGHGGNVRSLTGSGIRSDGMPKVSKIVLDMLSAFAAVDAHARAEGERANTAEPDEENLRLPLSLENADYLGLNDPGASTLKTV